MTAAPCPALSVTERLARWIASVRYDDLPESARAMARLQIASNVAAICAGAATEPGRAVRRAVLGWNKPGNCRVLPTGERTALHEAVLVNASLSMALDYDDYLYLGHTGHSAVLGSLALAEDLGLSGRDLVLAQVVANEIGGRLGASAVLGPQNGQAWSFLHLAEGAAAAAKLLGLDAEQTAHALAIALYQPTFTLWPGFMGPGSKLLTAAGPTVTGIQAAQFAREGLTGARSIVEHPRRGFWHAFSFVALPRALDGLGKVWLTETLAFKPYPGCAYVDTTLDAFFAGLERARAERGAPLAPDEVARVRVEASALTVEMDNLAAEHADAARLEPAHVNFSIPLSVAIGLLAGRLTGAEMRPEFLDARAAEVRALAARVELRHDWPMSFAVLRSFRAGPLGRLLPRRIALRDIRRLAFGARDALGGAKRHPLGFGRMFGPAARAIADRVKSGPPDEGAPFRMVFPARVTLVLRDGREFAAERDVPRGAPGDPDYADVVREKFFREVGEARGEAVAREAWDRVTFIEEGPVAALTDAVCREGS